MSSTPMATVPRPSQTPLPVTTVSTTPSRAKASPHSAAVSSSSTTGSSGAFARRTNAMMPAPPRAGRDSFSAVRSDSASITIETSSTATGSHQLSIGWGFAILPMPSYTANRPPRLNSTIDTTKADTYRSRPKPNGCSGVGARLAPRPPMSSRIWLPVSASECTDSASIDVDCESR
jgi:hypothetical protein